MPSDQKARGTPHIARWLAIIACGLTLFSTPAFSSPLDSIPVGPSEKIILQQSGSIPGSGAMSSLFVPARITVSFDYAVESGKQLLFVVITEGQMEQLNSGEKMTDTPELRATISGVGTQSVVLDRGTYGVYFVPDPSSATYLDLRARGGY